MNDGAKNQRNIDNDLDYENDSNLPFTPFDEGDYNEVDDIPSNPKQGSNPGKAIDTGGKAIQATGKGVDVAGKGMQVAGKGMQAAGKGMDAAGSALTKAGSALSSTGLGAIAGVPLAALGAAGKAAGTATNAAGKGVETAGKGVSKTGKTMQNAGKKVSDTGKRIKEATNKKSRTKPLKQKKNDQDNTNTEKGNNFDVMKSKSKSEVKKDEKNLKDGVKGKAAVSAAGATSKKGVVKKIIKKKIMIACGIFVIGVFLCFFVIELILGPLMEVWGNIDSAITGVADFSEKLSNFYYGFGFQNSKEAFYDELDDLCDRYGCALDGTGMDVPLILSTLFYTEGMGYDTNYGSTNDSNIEDPSMNGVGTNSGVLNSVREYLRGKFDEAQQTVDENGLTYSAGKIYRLRKLARNQFNTDAFGTPTKQGTPQSLELSKFLDKYKDTIGSDIYDLLKDLVGSAFNIVATPFKELTALIVGSEYSGEFINQAGQANEEFVASFRQVIGDIFYGIVDITDVKLEASGFVVYYKTWKFDEDNYKNYLINYYFENTPEFDAMLDGLDDTSKKIKKEELYDDIVSNKKLFEDIFLQYQNSSSEEYTEACVGAIDSTLISEGLVKPVKIDDSTSVSFTDEYAYGTINGKMHNGVDLNETTAGVKLGADVYSVSNGTVVSITESKSCEGGKSCGKTIKIKHNVVIDKNTFNFFTIYSNVTPISGLKVNTKVNKEDKIATIYNNKINKEGLHFAFLDANTDDKGIEIDPTNLFIPCSQGGVFSGSDNEEAVWNYLLGFGYSKNAVAGIMGNMSVESGSTFDGRIVQGDREPITFSIDYTNKVDSGAISKNDFVNNGPNGGGYGIVQWTYYTLKDGLYEYAKTERKITIGDTAMQLDYLDKFLQSDKKDLYNSLKDPNISIDSATRAFMIQFENPLHQEESDQVYRVQISQDIYNRHATSN